MKAMTMKMDCSDSSETQPNKPYETPQLIEHGTIEEITGFDDLGTSGVRDANPLP